MSRPPAQDPDPGVIGVLGAVGGVGASTFAAALARAAGRGLLVEPPGTGAGLDLLLGIGARPGARWSAVALDGGELDPTTLRQGLPRWQGISVLAADGEAPVSGAGVAAAPDAALATVIMAARRFGPVVVDAGACSPCAVGAVRATCDIAVVVTRGEPRALAVARVIGRRLAPVPTWLVIRRGTVLARESARACRLPLLGELPPVSGRGDGAPVPRAVARLARSFTGGTPARHR